MKKLFYAIAIAVLSAAFMACEKNEERVSSKNFQEEKFKSTENIYPFFKNFIENWDKGAIDKIETYFKSYLLDLKSTTTRSGESEIEMNHFLGEANNGIIYERILNNPSEGEEILRTLFSNEFIQYYHQLPLVSNEQEFVKEIISDNCLSSFDKSFLLLYVSSQFKDFNESQTRSLKSCVKRYAKLTEIAVGALATGFLDSYDKAVEYASNKLKQMGSEYDC